MLICSLIQTCLKWDTDGQYPAEATKILCVGNYSSRAPVTALSLLETVVFESTKVPFSDLHRLPSSINLSNFWWLCLWCLTRLFFECAAVKVLQASMS